VRRRRITTSADSTADDHADPAAGDRAASTADDRAASTADNRADSIVDDRSDSTEDDRVDSTAADDRTDSAEDSADSIAEQSDYTSMLAADGTPKPMEWVEWQRKMCDISKGKAPGYSGNTPDLYAPLPACWHERALKLDNLVQHTGATPSGWHIDLACYIHKGGDDGSLSNHRPL
jgi:hypothetical protein